MEKGAHPEGSADAPVLSLRFGPFEFDARRRELRRDGRRMRVQEQPFQILQMLLESPGDVVSREDIRKRLWPEGTVVEFDHSINSAVKRLRHVLRDSTEKPRYIETLSRRGYRFVGEVARGYSRPPSEPLTVVPSPQSNPLPRSPRFTLRARGFTLLVLAGILLIIVVGTTFYKRRLRDMETPLHALMRLNVDLGIDGSPRSDDGANTILSPDGTRLVYVSHSKLFTQRLDRSGATELSGTEGAQNPFFSPDGQWVAFFANYRLKSVSLQSGRVTDLAAVALSYGGSWGEDGNIIAAANVYLSRIPSSGGTLAPLTQLAPGEIAHRWPQLLPGGKAMLFSAYNSMTGLDGATIEVQSLKDGNRKTVVRAGTWGRYVPTGHLVYVNNGTLFAVPFDAERLEVGGPPTPVLEDVAYSTASGSAQTDFSRTGSLVYRTSRVAGDLVTVQWLDASGNTRPLLPVPGNYLSPMLSRDGKRLAVTLAGDIWVYELGRGSMMRLSFGGGHGNPLWTADGRYIVFRAARGMLWTRADGTGEAQPLTESHYQQIPWSFTEDGRRLAFVENRSPGKNAIWTLPVEVDHSGLRAGRPELFLQRPYPVRTPMISPDGQWLAYMRQESGRYRIYVEKFPSGGRTQQISGDGGTYPAWSPTGREIFFWQFDEGPAQGQIMFTSWHVRGDSFIADNPRPWSQRRLVSFPTTRGYDPAPDGKRVIALVPADSSQEQQEHVVFLVNFFDELRRRAPLR
jgi:DNA-binding winged helix-turn-helix (wHTH) protein/Tol biopolymer transport system component